MRKKKLRYLTHMSSKSFVFTNVQTPQNSVRGPLWPSFWFSFKVFSKTIHKNENEKIASFHSYLFKTLRFYQSTYSPKFSLRTPLDHFDFYCRTFSKIDSLYNIFIIKHFHHRTFSKTHFSTQMSSKNFAFTKVQAPQIQFENPSCLHEANSFDYSAATP